MSKATVNWVWCRCCGKRGFRDKHDAGKALGRAQAKRDRLFRKAQSRRGMVRESRYYGCDEGLFHLTSQSRGEFNRRRGLG